MKYKAKLNIGNCPILAKKYVTVRKALIVAIQKNLNKIIVESDSEMVTNSINVHKCIVKFVANVKMLSLYCKDVRIQSD